jgi:hypothetical protein
MDNRSLYEQITHQLKITQYNGEPWGGEKPNKTQTENNSVQWTIEKKNRMNWEKELKMTLFFPMSVFFPIHAILLFVHEQCEKKKETGKKSA